MSFCLIRSYFRITLHLYLKKNMFIIHIDIQILQTGTIIVQTLSRISNDRVLYVLVAKAFIGHVVARKALVDRKVTQTHFISNWYFYISS